MVEVKNADSPSGKAKYLPLLLVLLGLILRLIHVGGRSLRFEEGLIAQLVREDVLGVITGSTQNSTPVLFNLLVHYTLTIFGDSELIQSLVSIFSGVLLIYVVYLFGKRYFSRQVRLAAAVLAAISPYLIYYSQELRPYSLLTLFTFASAYCFLRALDTNKVVFWAATVLFNVLAIYTQPLGWLFVFVEAVYFLIFFTRHRHALWSWLISTAIVCLYYLPQYYFNRMLAVRMGWQFNFEVSPAHPLQFLIFSARRLFGTIMHYMNGYYFFQITTDILNDPLQVLLLIAMAGVPVLLLLFGLIRMLRGRQAIHLFLVLLFFFPFALAWMEGTSPKYFAMGAVPFLIICTLGWFHLGTRLRILFGSILVFTIAIALVDIYTSPTSTFSPENPRDLSRYVAAQRRPGDIVLFVGGGNGSHTWNYYNSEGTIYGNPFWSLHYYGIYRSQWPENYLEPGAFKRIVGPLLDQYQGVWLVMQTSKHDVVRRMIENLKGEYDIQLHYNQDWLNLAEVRTKSPTPAD